MRVLMLAPFERGRGQGGSQRATAIAERLESLGVEVGWQVSQDRVARPVDKLLAVARGEPSLVGLHEPPDALVPGIWDAAIVAHSYLVPQVEPLLGRTALVTDFHNLEWRHLADSSIAGSPITATQAVRLPYTRVQVAMMRRLERSVIRRSALNLFVSETERSWGRAVAPDARTLLVPSTLPLAVERSAAAIHSARAPEPSQLCYVGTLTFPPNLQSLEAFLATPWPAMRAGSPSLRLTVAGACRAADRERLERHPGVRTLGYVDDLTPLLARCAAVVMPFDGSAGTSLRALYFALAGLPVVGSRAAFRGVDIPVGLVAEDTSAWVEAARRIAGGSLAAPGDGQGRALARRLQEDPEPALRLLRSLEGLSTPADGTAGRVDQARTWA